MTELPTGLSVLDISPERLTNSLLRVAPERGVDGAELLNGCTGPCEGTDASPHRAVRKFTDPLPLPVIDLYETKERLRDRYTSSLFELLRHLG